MDTPVRSVLLLFLSLVFTTGLTFATLELPYLVDGLLQDTIRTPNADSHVDEPSRIKTELFMAHYHIRGLGYTGFFLLAALIAAGFSTRRTGLAALGALGVMLPVFAQFAGVMFFLAGLGVLNAFWLPVLDVSWELQHWGLVINAPNDLLQWLLGLAGIHSVWPTIIFFTATGILLFIAGVYAWLAARTGGRGVADALVYRLSRHPQYLGWILWTYGAYLLIQRALYPRRSWGIGASLPWLISTMVIIGVAMVEELNMRRRHGERYETYRRSAPFLFPVPRLVERIFALPQRLLFGNPQPRRRREALAVVAIYTVLFMTISAFFYAGGLDHTVARLSSPETLKRKLAARTNDLRREPDRRRRYHMMLDLATIGDPAVDAFIDLLEDEDPALRALGAEGLSRVPAARAVPALCRAAGVHDENVRQYVNRALGTIGTPETRPCLLALLDDPAGHIRTAALEHLAGLGDPEVLHRAPTLLEDPDARTRKRGAAILGTLGSAEALPRLIPLLGDDSAWVRQETVVALHRIGSPEARPHLERLLDDEDWEVRVYAAETLKRLPVTALPAR